MLVQPAIHSFQALYPSQGFTPGPRESAYAGACTSMHMGCTTVSITISLDEPIGTKARAGLHPDGLRKEGTMSAFTNASTAACSPGQCVGNYWLVRQLGQGGFATVYLGTHRYLGTHAAIKIVQPRLTEAQ